MPLLFIKSFVTCCEPLLNGNKIAATAIDLMRSRYSAYVLQHIDYLIATTHRSERDNYSREELLNWASSNTWLQLEIIDFIENKVEFKAYFLDDQNQEQIHHELSTLFLKMEVGFTVMENFSRGRIVFNKKN
jgi:SEC-C motif-containing protein